MPEMSASSTRRWSTSSQLPMRPSPSPDGPLNLDPVGQAGTKKPVVDAVEAARLARGQKRPVPDCAEVLAYRPKIFAGGHPLDCIETGEIHRTRVPAESFLAPEIEEVLEIRHGQLSQR